MMEQDQLELLDGEVQQLTKERQLIKLQEALDTFCETGFGKPVKHSIYTNLEGDAYNASTDGSNKVSISTAGFNFLQIRALSLHETAHLLFSRKSEEPTPEDMHHMQREQIQNGLEDGRAENKMTRRWPVTTNFLRWMAASDLVKVANDGQFTPQNLVAAMKWYVANFGRLHMPQGLKSKVRKLYESSGIDSKLLDKAEDCAKRYLLATSQPERDRVAIELTHAIREEVEKQDGGGQGQGSNGGRINYDPPGGLGDDGEEFPNANAPDTRGVTSTAGEKKADEKVQQEMQEDIENLSSEPPQQPPSEGEGEGKPEQQEQKGDGQGQGQGQQSPEEQQDDDGQPKQGQGQQGEESQDAPPQPPEPSEQDLRDELSEVGEQVAEMMEDETYSDTRDLASEVLGGIGNEPAEYRKVDHIAPEPEMKRSRDKLRRVIERIEIDGRALRLRKSGRIHPQTLMRRTCAGKGKLTNLRVFRGLAQDIHGGKLDVFIALDVSGSMNNEWLEQAGRLSWEVAQAVEQCDGRCKIIGFDTEVYHYKHTPDRCTIPHNGGGTRLSCVMTEAVMFFRQSDPRDGKLLVVLTDTGTGDIDRVAEMFHLLRKAGVVIWLGAILHQDSSPAVGMLKESCPFMNVEVVNVRGMTGAYGVNGAWRYPPLIHDTLMGAAREFLADFRKAMMGRG